MEKHYVIRSKKGSKKEKVFEGTLKEALELQKEWGTAEEEKITLQDVDTFLDLMMLWYFGDSSDGFVYEEVSEKEYNECD